MSQKISFKQPNKYSQNSPECSILTLEFLEPHPKIVPLALNYFLLFKIAIHLFSKKLLKILRCTTTKSGNKSKGCMIKYYVKDKMNPCTVR